MLFHNPRVLKKNVLCLTRSGSVDVCRHETPDQKPDWSFSTDFSGFWMGA